MGLMAFLGLAYAGATIRAEHLSPLARQIMLGLLFGGAGAVSMMIPVTLAPGLIFDVRSIPLILSGPFAGPWAVAVAYGVLSAVRILIGGAGVLPALISTGLIAVMAVGLGALRRRDPDRLLHYVALAGLAVPIPLGLGLLVLGWQTAVSILGQIGVPLAAAYAIGSPCIGWILLMADRRREAEQQLETARADAERANAAKSGFLAQVSHELRTPMSAITASLDLMAEDDLTPGQRSRLAVVRRSADNLTAMLNDLLDMSKMDAGGVTVSDEALDLDAVLAEVDGLYRGAAERKGLTFAVARDEAVPRFVRADSQRLKQVLGNLIGNAVKFTHRGEVRLSLSVGGEGGEGGSLLFTVRDTGIGMPSDRLPSVFEPFEQVSAETGRTYGGTGLGLAISKKLVEAMGGTITVQSAEGSGSHFTVSLPLVAADQADVAVTAQAALAETLAARPLEGRCILIAEDVAVLREAAAEMLKRLGAEVTAVADGAAAVDGAAGGYDVILLDMHMPVMDGFEAARHIRAREDHIRETPILGLTADADPAHIEGYKAEGVDDVVTKPVVWADLVQKVQRAAGSRNFGGRAASVPSADAAAEGESTAAGWNPDVLSELVMALGRDRARELLSHWPSSARDEMMKIERAVPADAPPDLDGAARAAHSLAGLAGNFGFSRLSDLARRVEARPRRDDAIQLTAQLREEVDAACDHVAGFLAQEEPS
jgi:signal transduction histidine kinase/DNA-binding NarL/FixJ family response regulator